jgi:hypothetical protein
MIEPRYIVFFEDDAEVEFSKANDSVHVDSLGVEGWNEMNRVPIPFDDPDATYVEFYEKHGDLVQARWQDVVAIKDVNDISIEELDKPKFRRQ